jgi:hypothetical protein
MHRPIASFIDSDSLCLLPSATCIGLLPVVSRAKMSKTQLMRAHPYGFGLWNNA